MTAKPRQKMSGTGITLNIIISGIICVLGTIGNACVIFAYIKVPSIRTVNNIFVTQLAIVDFLKACFILPLKVANQAQQKTSMNSKFCPIFGMLRVICSSQSALVLATVAVVRFWKVVRPYKFHTVFSTRRTMFCCASLVLVTFLLSLLPIIGVGQYRYSFSHGACFVDWSSENIAFRSIYYVFTVGIPLPVLLYCYTKIFKLLRTHRRLIAPTVNRNANDEIEIRNRRIAPLRLDDGKRDFFASEHITSSPQPANRNPSRHSQVNTDKEPKKPRNDFEVVVTHVMFAIVIAYVICWTPAFITNILNLSNAVHFPSDVLLLAVTLVDLKVFLNPLIYIITHKRFRKRFLHAFIELNR